MAAYDQIDWTQRLLALFPIPWASFDARQPGGLLYSVCNGIASPFSALSTLLVYVQLQTRLQTATDINLDLISEDFFGGALPRLSNESDARYRGRILSALVSGKTTFLGLTQVLNNLGLTFHITEDGHAQDMLCLGVQGSLSSGVGFLGANGTNASASYMKILTPLPNGLTQQNVLDTINAYKAEGCTVWVSFTPRPFHTDAMGGS